MVGLGIVISFLVVLMNMHTMILERTREIGILKALGFSRFDVVKMLLGETLFLTMAGSLLGIGITFLTESHPETNQPRPLHPPNSRLGLRLHRPRHNRRLPRRHRPRHPRLQRRSRRSTRLRVANDFPHLLNFFAFVGDAFRGGPFLHFSLLSVISTGGPTVFVGPEWRDRGNQRASPPHDETIEHFFASCYLIADISSHFFCTLFHNPSIAFPT